MGTKKKINGPHHPSTTSLKYNQQSALPDIVRELFDNSPQGVLCVVRHGIGLVQNDELVAAVKDGPGGRKVHDLPPHDSNPAIVTGIQLQNPKTPKPQNPML